MKNLLTRIAAISIPLLLAACGDTINEQINANVGAVESSKDLPECTKDIAGQTAFVSETHEFLGCDGKEWQTLSANTVSVGDNVCTSTSLSDGTGFEIFCNGASIGTVKNGEKGDKGDTGEKGDAGMPGAKGDTGEKGADGQKGDKGDTGAKGDKGDDGAPGTNGTNGTNGKDGVPGADGTGCRILESTALTATIACGSETFTMDLTGYVDVPEECDPNDEGCAVQMDDVELSGVSQKGPFVSGTDVTAYELENGRSLKQTGKTFGGKIENQDGSFNIRTVKLKSSFAYLVADGFYRNEVTGRNSAATIKLRALTNLDGRSTANINLVTHLEYDRVQRLVTKDNKSVIEAKRAAEKSLFAAFNIDNSGFKGFAEDLNIFKEGDGNAALLAVSAMLQGDRNESELTALLASFSVDLGDNGVWDDSLQRAQIADWAMKADVEGRLATIRANVEGWKLSDSEPPAFEGHVTNFWTKELDVPACSESNPGRLFAIKNEKSSFYAKNDSVYTAGDSSLVRLICDASGETPAWRFATDIEKNIAAFTNPSEGMVKRGSIDTVNVFVYEKGLWRNGTDLDKYLEFSCIANRVGTMKSKAGKLDTTWYKCDTDPIAWREATTAEADTALFGVPQTAKDSVKAGNIDKSHVYVYEDDGWRRGTDLDREDGLGGCIATRIDSVRQKTGAIGADGWYKCVTDVDEFADGVKIPSVWRRASSYEVDMIDWNLNKDLTGKLLPGTYSGMTMVWDSDTLRQATETERKLRRACVSYIYGTQDRLANSLLYSCTRSGWSQKGSFSDHRTYHVIQLYHGVLIGNQTWMTSNLNYATENSYCYDDISSNCEKYGRLYTWSAAMEACPEGWHLPSKEDWHTLITYVGGENVAGDLLKSQTGWSKNGNGVDAYSFTILPAGHYDNVGYIDEGTYANFWSSTEYVGSSFYGDKYAYYVNLACGDGGIAVTNNTKTLGFSVRCVSDVVLE